GRLGRTCAACGTAVEPVEKFCGNCGASLGVAVPAERAPATYTPRHLAEKILTSRAALEGERKQVTVLFADVKGSMELAERVDPEAWHRILDRFFAILADGVHRFEGTVNQFTGDGVMALFGAPLAHEDHARRACAAALHLGRSEEHTSELQSRVDLVCRLLLEKKKKTEKKSRTAPRLGEHRDTHPQQRPILLTARGRTTGAGSAGIPRVRPMAAAARPHRAAAG